MSDSSPQVPFGDALLEAVKGLRGQPPLLAAVAIALALVAAAVAAGDVVRAVAIPLVVILALGLAAWVYIEARRRQHGEPGISQRTRFGRRSKQKDVHSRWGDVTTDGSVHVNQDVEFGAGSSAEGVTVEHGNVTGR